MRESAISIHVPFKYDLGGQVRDISGIRGILMDLCESVEVDQATTRSWNLSYLALHSAVLRCRLPDDTANIAGSHWRYGRSLSLFPWLGVISVDYEFESIQDNADMLSFYDGLVRWKNTDYLPYLKKCGVATEDLSAHTALSPSASAQDLHSSLVLQLRARAQPYISPRPALYAFHDFRVCFIDKESTLDPKIVQCLLWLTTREESRDDFDHVGTLKFRTAEISSTGWSTVLRSSTESLDPEVVATTISLLNLAHAQWFVCQAWINIYEPALADTKNTGAAAEVHELSASQLSLARDLSEVGNFDIMLKDPNLLRVARSFERTFTVLEHRKAAEQRLRILADHSMNLAQYANERTARRLAVLFSLSAAGTIAALVPALVQIGFPPLFTLLTFLLLVILWLGFTINFTVLLRQFLISRKTRGFTLRGKHHDEERRSP
ncbi:MAG: hypothetical protein ACRDTX_04590 [Pseudonocardiaceae bacterium]